MAAFFYISFSFILAFASITITGYEFGVENNVFHIPYVLSLAETSEFKGDSFYASLKNFTSIIWPSLQLVSDESNVKDVFFAANLLSRAAAFSGLLFLARESGLNTIPGMTMCMAGAALTPWLQSYSIVGQHGMFIDYFTHSEVTWPFVFVSLTLLPKKRLVLASAATGITFSVNAFVGIWLLLASAMTMSASEKAIDHATIMKSAGAFILFAAPVLLWIAATVGGANSAEHFSYIEYVRQYYSGHFLIEATSWQSLAMFALVLVGGLIAAQHMPEKHFWIRMQLALSLIFALGIPLPYLIDNKFVFNLHLLRSAGIVQAVAIILILIAGTRLSLNTGNYRSNLLGLVVMFSMIAFDKTILGLSVIILSLSAGLVLAQENKRDHKQRPMTWSRCAGLLVWTCIALFVLALTRVITKHHIGLAQAILLITMASTLSLVFLRGLSSSAKCSLMATFFLLYSFGLAAKTIIWRARYNQSAQPETSRLDDSWTELVEWIRVSDIHGIFLVPVMDERFNNFQLQARRQVWVDWKQGAAVMWCPSFYSQWMPRYKSVSVLEKPEEFIEYAQMNNIKKYCN